MSLYQFFSSDKPLAGYNNGKVISDNKGNISVIDEANALCIFPEDDTAHMKSYTKKKFGAFIEWNYSDKNAETVIRYIKEHLKSSRVIELWNTWLDQKETADVSKCHIDNLTVSDIKNIWGKEFYEHAECLKIYY